MRFDKGRTQECANATSESRMCGDHAHIERISTRHALSVGEGNVDFDRVNREREVCLCAETGRSVWSLKDLHVSLSNALCCNDAVLMRKYCWESRISSDTGRSKMMSAR